MKRLNARISVGVLLRARCEFGYRLLRRWWRRGYGGEGSKELVRYGFADLGLNRIFAQTMAVNTASRATMTASGLAFARAFTTAGPADDPVSGAEQGDVEYEITRAAWQNRHSGSGSAT